MTATSLKAKRPEKRRLDKTTRLRIARAASEGRTYDVPVRKVIVKSPVRILRELQSVKMRATLPCESSIEYDWATVLDVDPDVSAFRVQPRHLRYTDVDGRPRWTVPDVLVDYVDGRSEYHEVKRDIEADCDRQRARTAALEPVCAADGLVYRVVRESEVRAEPRLSNARELRRYRRHAPSSAFRAHVFRLLSGHPSTRLDALLEALGKDAREDVLALVLRGMLSMDWKAVPIGGHSLVRA